MKKIWICKAVILFLICTFMTGCWNSKQIEHTVYLHAIGVDYVDQKYVVYVQVLDFSSIAKKESGGGQATEETVWVGKGIGDNLDLALHDIYPSSQERISWGQIQAIVFSEAVLKYGLDKGVLDVLNKYYEFRQTMWVYGSNTSIEALFNAHPIGFVSPLYSRLSDPEGIYKQNSFIKPIRFNQFITQYYEPASTTLLPVLSVTNTRWKEKGKDHSVLQRSGVFLLHDSVWRGHLPNENIKGLRWMQKATVRTPLPILSDKAETVGAVVLEDPRSKIIPIIQKGRTIFDIQISVQGTVMETKHAMSKTYIERQVAKFIEKQIKDTYQQGLKLKTDVLQLSESLYRDHPDVWREQQKDGILSLDKDSIRSVDVKVKITTTGRSKLGS